jgi:hypothetical protein
MQTNIRVTHTPGCMLRKRRISLPSTHRQASRYTTERYWRACRNAAYRQPRWTRTPVGQVPIHRPLQRPLTKKPPKDHPGPILRELFKNPFTGEPIELERVFIPSQLTHNKKLMENDPLYVARLQQQGSANLVKAWLEGDWDIILGSFFDCWSEANVLSTGEWLGRFPREALRFRAFDWGSAKPFCVGWYAISDGTWGLPKGALLKYREWYGSTGQPNVGLKMDAERWRRGSRSGRKARSSATPWPILQSSRGTAGRASESG